MVHLLIVAIENIDQSCQTTFPSLETRYNVLNDLYIRECKIKIHSVIEFPFWNRYWLSISLSCL